MKSLFCPIVKELKEDPVVVHKPDLSRFPEYFNTIDVAETSHLLGVTEPAELKAVRPFLLSTEAISSGGGKNNNRKPGKKGKGKGKKGNTEIGKLFPVAQRPPGLINFSKYDNKPYKIVASYEQANSLTTSVSVPTFQAFYYYATMLDQFSSLAAVFDQYKIDAIETWFTSNLDSNAISEVGILSSVIDYDDANALSTINQALDYENNITAQVVVGHYRKFKPHAAVAMYSGTFVSYGNVESPWIDCGSAAVQHYGVKLACTVCSQVNVINQVARFHVSFRNVR